MLLGFTNCPICRKYVSFSAFYLCCTVSEGLLLSHNNVIVYTQLRKHVFCLWTISNGWVLYHLWHSNTYLALPLRHLFNTASWCATDGNQKIINRKFLQHIVFFLLIFMHSVVYNKLVYYLSMITTIKFTAAAQASLTLKVPVAAIDALQHFETG